MSEPKVCCNCLHCARWKKKDGVECHCDLTDRYLSYLDVMETNCEHWEKETKWDLQKEHDRQIRTKVIDEVKQYLLKHAKTVREIETKHIYDAVKVEWIIDLKEGEQNEEKQ